MSSRARAVGWARRPLGFFPRRAQALCWAHGVTDPDAAERIHKFYAEVAIPAELFARAVAFAISQPEDVDVNEILFRPTRQEL